jgi:hypothetical protein
LEFWKTLCETPHSWQEDNKMQDHDLVAWLLDAKTPSIRYRTMTDLLGYPAEDASITQARQALMTSGPVPAILARQVETGAWSDEHSYYTPKYVSTHWSMLLLTELDVDGNDPRFRQGVCYMLAATAGDSSQRLGSHLPDLACFWGNLLRYACHAGMADDAQVERVVHYAAHDVQAGACRCVHNDGHACAWGVVRALWGLAALPQARRTPAIDQAIQEGIEFLLGSFRLVEADYPTPNAGSVHPLWFKLNFPLFYQADILFTLRVVEALDVLDHPGAQAALDWLAQRQGRNGRWSGSSPFRQRTWREMGDREETGRWVSLHAARILRRAGRLPASYL